MIESPSVRERHAWIAVVAVLATSLGWLAAIGSVLAVRAFAVREPASWVAVRAVWRVMINLLQHSPAALPAVLLAVGIAGLLIRALTSGNPSRRRVSHA